MRRLVALAAGTALLLAAGSAMAGSITLSTSELLLAHVVTSNTDASNWGDLRRALTTDGVLFTQNMSRPLNSTPDYVYSYVGVNAGAIGKSDLSGVDSFQLQLANTNNSPWDLALFVQADDVAYCSDYRTVPNQQSPVSFEGFTFDLSSLGTGISSIDYLGFAVRSTLDGDPSNPDAYHVVAAPTPEPGTLLLLGAGALGLAILFKRRENS
ncbi:PEP-CTERM sorting domain-containing protein [Geomonas oryzae]|uniref:PEP-CTERM sorting domain-containing protein n=1 Tax=Geomonas oryzae TaxID=2364273 RepID=UPI001FEC1D69|nr:PEP-CTERM sorting domain-containing protein [Geomonas oryzae]